MFNKYQSLLKNNISENPFLIDTPDKYEYTLKDYENIQEKLHSKNLDSIVESLYSSNNRFIDLAEFKRRIFRGIKQRIIDISNNLLPTKTLYKIGNGGNMRNCVVTFTSFTQSERENEVDNTRYLASQKIVKALEDVGFNGYFYLISGGFPNPTGTEMKYAGIPYSFKILTMLEAQRKGFDKVIWIDSVCLPINNPQKLFDILYEQDTIISSINYNNNYEVMSFEKTVELLNEVTQEKMHFDTYYVETTVFGLNLESEIIQKIIKDYYEMLELGWPFFSVFPEEIVLCGLFNKPEYKFMLDHNHEKYKHDKHKLRISEQRMNKDDAKNDGFYFYQIDYSKK
jgi:hypothetical protein